ncbi:MAG: sel1 repeat family protein, partial [Clostridia bacterium]|nr:sel1 repeat family protein [Clostridia bacterium]
YCYLCMQQYDDAYKWFLKASEQGVAWAYGNIGWMYENGCGVKQDYAQAFGNYEIAALLGDMYGYSNSAWLLQNGWGVAQDYKKAFDYWLKAAQMGNVNAQNSVGLFYKNGWGVAQDQEKAAEWFVRALQNGEQQYAATNLYWVSSNFFGGSGGAEKSEKRAFELGLISAQYKCADAMAYVGDCYHYGWGTECDLKQAKHWYQKAFDEGKDVASDLERVNKELSEK